MDFLKYVLQEVKSRRLSHPQALDLVHQYQEGAGTAASAQPVLHPLVHRNTSTLAQQRYSATFSGDEFFFAEHLVRGQRILPGVAHLELARAAIAAALELEGAGCGLCLEGVVFLRPIMAQAGPDGTVVPMQVHVVLSVQEDGAIDYRIEGETDADGAPLVYSQGRARVLEQAAVQPLDLESMTASAGEEISAERHHELYVALGFGYGPQFELLERVRTGRDAAGRGWALGELNQSRAPRLEAGFALHPGMMDCALQVSTELLMSEPGQRAQRLALPFAMERVEILAPVPARARVLARLSPGSTADDTVTKVDLQITDEAGAVCVRLAGFSSRVLDHAAADTASTQLLQAEWRVADAALRDARRHWVVLCDTGAEARQQAQRQWPGAQLLDLQTEATNLAQRYGAYAGQLLDLVQTLAAEAAEETQLVSLVVPQSGAGRVFRALAGLLRSAALEHARLEVQLVGTGEAGLQRLQHMLEEPRHGAAVPLCKQGGVYLISGGLGGLGQLVAQAMAQQAQAITLVLTGRRTANPDALAQLRERLGSAAQVEYHALDVADVPAVAALVAGIRARHGRLDGVIHSAGVLRDSLAANKTHQQLQEVLAPKVNGVLALDEATRDDALDYFIAFSSTSGVLGNVGQTDYSAANAFLDECMAQRRERVEQGMAQGRSLSVSWPLWKEGGMRVDEATQERLWRSAGLAALPTEAGLQALRQALAQDAAHIVVLHGDAARIQQLRERLDVPPREVAQSSPAAVEGDDGELLAKIERALIREASALLKLPAQRLSLDTQMTEFGFDSITQTAFGNQLNKKYGLALSPTQFFETTTLGALARYLARAYRAQMAQALNVAAPASKTPTTPAVAASRAVEAPQRFARATMAKAAPAAAGTPEPVAVIGMSGVFPLAPDLAALWENLHSGRDCITEVPKERWDWDRLASELGLEPGHKIHSLAGVIDNVAEFDPMFFRISPREALTMDPQQRLLMTYVWKAVEDAGYAPQSLAGSRTALFVGTAASGYASLLAQARTPVEGYSNAGTVASMGPNRTSYWMGWCGPSEPIDTACSSALVAIHRAVTLLQMGQCDLAVVGGVNALVSPEAQVSFIKAGMLAEDGRCKTFSAQANGYVRGEGVGMLVLKPLSAAERDGDHIYGLIRSSSQNHGGKASSLTAPNPRAQADLIKEAFERAGVDPATVGYIEAHGTGTPLGDPIEVQGLKTAFEELAQQQGRPLPSGYCGLGSIKTNIGHLELSAGVAGVIKVLLQMQHKTLAKSLHSEEINPYIQLDGSPFYIVQQTREWEAPRDAQGRELPRRAGVSSFGFGGANAHVVLEEYVASETPAPIPVDENNPALLVLSAKDEQRLQDQVRQLLGAIERGVVTQDNLANAAYTLQVGRDAMEMRLACVVGTVEELREKLTQYLQGDAVIDRLYRDEVKRHKETLAAFEADAEMQEAIAKWVQRGKLDKLADLWVKGLNHNWNTLYSGRKPRRIALPTYPFARDRYWASPAQTRPRLEHAGRSDAGAAGGIETVLLQPEWLADSAAAAEATAYDKHLVLLCDSRLDAAELSGRLEPANCRHLPHDYMAQAETVLGQLQSLLQDKPVGPVLVQLVVPASGPQQVGAALAGLLKSARLEHPKLAAQVIAIDHGDDAGLLAATLRENSRRPQDMQIRYVAGQRQVLAWSELADTVVRHPWKAGGVYLITGGLGGLGRIFAKEIARQAPGATLVLTGRREPDEAGRRVVRELEAEGAKVDYRAVDVANRVAVEQLVLHTHEDHAGLNGIVHSAGVIRDGLLSKKTAETLREVLSAKVAGLINLDEASRDIELDCFICFSSLAAVHGNVGQADYAAGNAFMDSYAAYRNSLVAQGQRHGRTLSVNWPLWRDGGMQVDAATEQAMAATTGMVPLRSESGIEALYRALGSGLGQVAVIEGDAARIRHTWGGGQTDAAAADVSTATADIDQGVLRDKVRQLLIQAVSSLMMVKEENINPDAEFSEHGLDSVALRGFADRLNQDYGTRLVPTLFFEHPTLNGLTDHLIAEYRSLFAARFGATVKTAPAPVRLPALRQPGTAVAKPIPAESGAGISQAMEPIAIIGISGCFPLAEDIDAFWRHLAEGKDCITEVPSDRWDWRAYYGDPATEQKTRVKWGGFIDGVAEFDPLFFGISPKEAEQMDPQQRLLMLHVWKVIEDAGYAAANLAGSNTAIFVGTGSTGYTELMQQGRMAVEGFTSTGTVPSVGPNRMSYFLDLHGPSQPVETACSSSLVAIRRGVLAIENGESDVAIVGGINTLLTPDVYVGLSKAGMLCEDGRCKTFSERANGYVRGEGVGMLMLKRLSLAERDGDHIYGLITGTAENHGGRANSLTSPNPKAQAELIKAAFRKAGVDPRTVGYIEAHGTGTPLGDPIEINGLKQAFRDLYAATGGTSVERAHCGIGAVKSNIGHLEMAAGVAGVIKVLLQMRHRTLVPSLNCDPLNPYVELDGSPFYIVRERHEWEAPRDQDGKPLPRRAGVSSFGFGGVNAHVVLEEYVPKAPLQAVQPVDGARPALIVLSAKNAERLQDRVRQLHEAVRRGAITQENLADVAYTLQVGREAMEVRLGMLVDSVDDLSAKLAAVAAGKAADEVYRGELKRNQQDMALFAADEDAARLLESWLSKRKYGKVLDLWVKGLAVDWNHLYGDGERRPHRISLPTYPFARDRYWVPAAGHGAAVAAVPLHPLVQRNTSDSSGQRFSSTLTGNEFFLADHLIRGKRVLPGVAHLEMVREAIRLAYGEEGIAGLQLSHVGWVRPIVVDGAPVEVHIGLLPQDDGGIAYEIFSHADGERRLHSQGRAHAGAAGAAEVVDLAQLKQACPDTIPAEQVYARYQGIGMAHGVTYRVVSALYRGEGLILGRLLLPPEALAGGRFGTHPCLLDGALQTLIGFVPSEAGSGQTSLPFALQKLDMLSDTCERMWVVARFSAGSQASDHVHKFDMDLCDDDGRVCVRYRGFTTRVLEGKVGGDAGATEPLETLLLQPQWRTEPAVGTPAACADHLVLLCGSKVDASSLASRLEGARCLHLPDDYAAQAEAVMEQLQALMPGKAAVPVLVQLVVPASGPQQTAAGLAGLLKTARLEHPRLIGQVIAVDGEDDVERLAATLRENSGCSRDVQIRYADGERQVLGWRELAGVEPVTPWQAGGVYLITGGLGGLGLLFAREIARQAKGAVLVLTGRRPLDEAGRGQLRELEALGARVDYRTVDVADRDAVSGLVLQVQEEHEALNGIVHSAGVIRDSLLLKKTAETLREVLSAKVAGLINLDEASRDIELDCFICFSSLAAVHGNVGQADYAAGNAFMDSYAAYRNSLVVQGERHGRTLSVNWPLWRDGGMQVDAATEQAMAATTGMVPLRSESGIEALYRALGSGLDQVAVIEGYPARIRQTLLDKPAAYAAAPASRMPAAIAGDAGSGLREKAGQYFRKLFATALHLAPQQIEIDAPLEKYGINSLMVMNLTSELERVFGPLSKTLLFEYQTLEALADFFLENYAAQLQPLLADGRTSGAEGERAALARVVAAVSPVPAQASMPVPSDHGTDNRSRPRDEIPAAKADDIAIIGVAGRYPQARDLTAYWQNLRNGIDCITEIPKERWDHSQYFDPDKTRPGKSYTKWGGFIDGVDEFDPQFFNLLPRDAEMADPQERLFLQCAYAALEDAGYTRETLEQFQAQGLKGNVGVYVGVMFEEYQLHAAQQQLLGNPVTVSGSPGSIANRVSYVLNLHGPSMAVDTMCSSSLTAIHLACESLQRGSCEMAIAGGVNVSIHPNKYLILSQSRFASSKGQCESFGVGGDGYVPGEGVGAVILKPLQQAVADGDHIHGVIKATSINHGGKTNGYTVPNPVAQANVIARTLKAAGIHPRTISYIEAHGTGTSLGDPIEITGLGRAFGEHTRDRQFCAIGSVKSNIGHGESAAGIAGLTKVLLQMKHGQLVPSLHSRELNPNIDFTRTPFVVQQELAEWRRPVVEIDGVRREYPRIAGISSFGAGGSNAHMIVEEWAAEAGSGYVRPAGQPVMVVLSAKNPDRLQERVQQLLEAVERGEVTSENLADAAYTLQVGREAMDARLALVADSAETLRDKLKQVLQGVDAIDEVYRGDAKRHKDEMSLLAADEDLAGLIAGWVAKGRHGRLLELWTKGLVVDWNRLYGDGKGKRPRRISLPAYPFARERYWMPVTAGNGGSQASVVSDAGMIETLLLQPVWRAAPAATGEAPAYADHLVLLCENLVDLDALSSELGSARCEQLPDDYADQAKMVLERLQTLLQSKPSASVLVQLVVPAFGPRQMAMGLAGLLRSARPEYPRLVGQVIAVDREDDAGQLAAKLRENSRCPRDLQIRYADGERQVPGWTGLADEALRQPWKTGGVYLITGGLGGLGRIFAREIAEQTRGVTLVLTGRRELDDTGRQQIRELEASGAKVEYRAVDVADREAVRRLVLQVHEDHEGLNGILHSAGVVVHDRLFMKKTSADIDAVFAPKVPGLINLDEASRDIDLDCFICFSSTSAVLGIVGHADYAAANAFMDAYAAYRNSLVATGQRHGRTLSVNWHLWQEGGMQVDAAIERAMERQTGMVAIRRNSGVQALYRAYGSDLDQVAVVAGDPARIRRMFSGRTSAEGRLPVTAAVAQPPRAAAPAVVAQGLAAQVERMLIGMAAALAKVTPNSIDADTELHEYGFDSITVAELGNRLNQEFQLDLAPTVFFQYPTLGSLACYLSSRHQDVFSARFASASMPAAVAAPDTSAAPPQGATVRQQEPVAAAPAAAADASAPIAIIGITGRFPQADDLDMFWQNLRAGRDCVTEVPKERWDAAAYFDPRKGIADKTYSRWGGFIDGIEQFDALFFNISPREAQMLDVQTRQYLQTVWNLLESGGHTRESLRRQYQGKVGIYLGAMPQPELAAPSDVANRVSHFFNFEGPSIAIDTMCSSAVVAIHLACRDLREGECALAVAGGINLPLSPARFVGLSQMQQAGSHAQCRSFAEGDGYLPSEGIGAVLLKPLHQAIADGDPILAVIKGTATRHSGRANGYGVSNPGAQARVIEDSLRRANAAPSSISYIEAAATGSALADAIEIAALNSVFGPAGEEGWRCPIGAVKSGLGHPEWASGIAQLAKVLLQMQHRQLVPLVSVGTPNRQLRLEETPFYLQQELTEWKPAYGPDGQVLPRRALIDSFGAGGAYACMVIEEYLPSPARPQQGDAAPHEAQVFVFSARTGERLRATVEQSLRQLERDHAVNLRDLACTLQLGREAMDSRLAVIASTREELIERLQASLEGRDTLGMPLYRSVEETAQNPLQHLLAGTAGESMVEALIAARNLEGLALYWAQGGAVPWSKLYAGKAARKIAWPTYPFARNVYPIGAASVLQATSPQPAMAAPTDLPAGTVTTVAAGSGIGTLIVEVLAATLGISASELPLNKPLQTLGYKSIAAMELKYRLEAALGRTIGLELIGDGSRSIADLSRHLAEYAQDVPDGSETGSPALPVLVSQPQARHEPFPLTDMQEAFLLGRRSSIAGDRIGAHIYAEIDVEGALDIFRLNKAWNGLIARHDMLRAVFIDGGLQRILPAVRDYRFKVVDLRRLGEAERMAKAGALRESMEHHVFSGAEWPLFDIRVAIHGEGRYRIHFSIDELIVDGLSVDTLVRQWDWLYANPGQALPAMELSFRDYVLAMKAFEASAKYRQDLAYWLGRLENLPGGPQLSQPAAAPDSAAARRRTRLHYHLPAAGWAALQAKAAALGISPTSLVLSVFAEVLRAWTTSPTFTLVLTYFNRPPLHPQIRELIGPAISSLLFVVEPRSGDDFDAIAQGHHQRLWQDLDHSSVSGIQVLRQLRNRPGSAGRRSVPAALPVVFTSMLGTDVTGEQLEHLGDVVYVVNQTPQVYLDHQVRDSAGGLDCSWDVAEDCFAPGYVRALFDAYSQTLAGLADGGLAWTVDSFTRTAAAKASSDPTTALLAGFLREVRGEDPLGPFRLTDQQNAYAFGRDARLEGGGSSCQFYQELLVERLDAGRLEQAVETLIARHPMLRTVVHADGSQAVLAQTPRYAIDVADLRGQSPEARQAALAATRRKQVERVVPLGAWPYFTVTVSLLGSETACVHLCFDLMLVDSTGIGQLLTELIHLYQQPRAELPVPALTFRDYQRAVERFQTTPDYTERLAYWNRKFADLPAGPALPRLPVAKAADAHQRIGGELRHWGALKQYAATHGIAPGLILLTAYLEVLYAWNDQRPLTVVVPGWERLPVHPDIERVVGDFTTLSWVTRGSQVVKFATLLAQVTRQHADDLAQRPVSGLQALRRVMLRDRQRQLRFPVVFTNQITPLALPGTQFQLGEAISKTPQVYLDNLSSEADNRLHCSWDFAGSVYAPAMVKEMFDGYLRLLELLGSDPLAWQRTDFSDVIRARPRAYGVAADMAVAP